ncbi:RNA dependent RNA polymerase [Plasmopara viticola lesion associated ourmia-like virus 18]|uniref:RNA dependent RNA polymerase n=1 Tax=Plasmopara viticola lesion associated ourmia-like virus 18 TaxID=2686485 RepID=A0ABX6FLX4_9VIRU|nr:RNA dependent RNA polymerase [Plasmopara viticola lesion associated ourmia-like virus 18]QGY72548.1 RNA dependent RNA polymerase [Plasmopara viticola lesion associated ourmia-like virus 18]
MSGFEVRVRNIALRCTRSSSEDIISRLERFSGLMSEIFKITLTVPTLRDNSHIKHFCSDLLEGKSHPWKETIRRLSSRGRLSVAASLFMFRKLIASAEPDPFEYIEKMSHKSPEPSSEFIAFCVRRTKELFPRGWDRSYVDKVLTATLPVTSSAEFSRASGGVRRLKASERWDRNSFVEYCLTSQEKAHRCASVVVPVETGGKWRVISKPPSCDHALKPLHKCMYDHLSKFPWLLRGDAKPGRFKEFVPKDGEVFVSGDYESATDNLCTPVQRAILVALLTQCRNVPLGVREHAVDTLSSDLKIQDGHTVLRQQRGQLMGEPLSFPLLCLVNYLTFEWSVGTDAPVRINGDDIVFRTIPDLVSKWEKEVGKSGLVLSVGKTMKSNRYYSLNSSFFDSHDGSFVPLIRPKAVWSSKERGCEQISSLHGRFHSFHQGFFGIRKRLLQAFFLNENRGNIFRSRRSVTRALGLKVDEGVLRGTDLWHRELYYLEQDNELPLPSRSFSEVRCNDIPKSWTRVSPHWYPADQVKEWGRQFAAETIQNAWENDVLLAEDAEKEWWTAHDMGCSPYSLSGLGNRIMRSMLRLTKPQLWRWYTQRRNKSVFGRVNFSRGKGVWRPDTTAAQADCVEHGDVDEKGKVELKVCVGTIWEEFEEDVRLVRAGPGTAVRFTSGRAFFGPPPTYDSSLLQSGPASAVVVS